MAMSLSAISSSMAGLASVVSSDEQAVSPAVSGRPTHNMLKSSCFVFISFLRLVWCLCYSDIAALGVLRARCDGQYRHPVLIASCVGVAGDADLAIADAEKQRRKKVMSKYSVKVTVKGVISDGLGTNRDYSKDVIFLVEPIAKQLRY